MRRPHSPLPFLPVIFPSRASLFQLLLLPGNYILQKMKFTCSVHFLFSHKLISLRASINNKSMLFGFSIFTLSKPNCLTSAPSRLLISFLAFCSFLAFLLYTHTQIHLINFKKILNPLPIQPPFPLYSRLERIF